MNYYIRKENHTNIKKKDNHQVTQIKYWLKYLLNFCCPACLNANLKPFIINYFHDLDIYCGSQEDKALNNTFEIDLNGLDNKYMI